jgi:hypothetical protein
MIRTLTQKNRKDIHVRDNILILVMQVTPSRITVCVLCPYLAVPNNYIFHYTSICPPHQMIIYF